MFRAQFSPQTRSREITHKTLPCSFLHLLKKFSTMSLFLRLSYVLALVGNCQKTSLENIKYEDGHKGKWVFICNVQICTTLNCFLVSYKTALDGQNGSKEAHQKMFLITCGVN